MREKYHRGRVLDVDLCSHSLLEVRDAPGGREALLFLEM